jgi:hypothetical protein
MPWGHYGRGDVFSLTVQGVKMPIPIGDEEPSEAMSDHIWRVPSRQFGKPDA